MPKIELHITTDQAEAVHHALSIGLVRLEEMHVTATPKDAARLDDEIKHVYAFIDTFLGKAYR